jgi:tetratricopeptide (TPR) repeat protein
MQIVGLEPRRSDLARGIIVVRTARPLDANAQQALWEALAAAGVTTRSEEEVENHAADPDRQLHAAPWLPPAADEIEAQTAALQAAGTAFDVEAVWFVKVETGCDGRAWRQHAQGDEADDSDDSDDSDDIEDEAAPAKGLGGQHRSGSEPGNPVQEVLYAAPDAPVVQLVGGAPISEEDEGPDSDDLDEDDGDDDLAAEEVPLESAWRNGPPPLLQSVPFPLDRYPEIVDDYDRESFGIAVKLSGQRLPGEESVVNALFALWLSVYQDERCEDFEPFQRADVIHDPQHRSALMWVENFSVPVTAADQVHFLLWIANRLHNIVPIAWARFETEGEAATMNVDGSAEPLVLAGNPFAEMFHRQGGEAALAWTAEQREWSPRELAAMMIEVALEHDPEQAATAAIAERLLRQALRLDPSCDADGYLAIVLVRQGQNAQAITLARDAGHRGVRLLVLREIAEHASGATLEALDLLDPETAALSSPEELAELVTTLAHHAPAALGGVLRRLPNDVALVPTLYNASFAVERPQALAVLRRVLALPEPSADAGGTRTALVMAWNNACIHAHALGDYRLAVELADGGQRFAAENPYIYHSAACAYAAVGDIDRAIAQVALAIDHEYDHSEKMEVDRDLSVLHADPRFPALFAEWRAKRADLN